MAGPVRWRSCVCALVVAGCVAGSLPGAGAQSVPMDASTEATSPEAWLPHPLPAPVVPKVAFVGDSIGRDAQYYLRNQVERTHHVSYYHSVAAGYIGYHLPRLMPVIKAANGPDILLVELGTGDAFWDHSSAQFEADIRHLLDRVLPYVTCVRWFDQKPTANVAYPEVNEHRTAFNRILARVLAEPRYASKNVALVSYAAWYYLAGDRGYFLADLLHHTEQGRRELGLLAGQAAAGCDPATAPGPFWDVPDTDGAAAAIAWMGAAGIADPYRNGTYRARLGSFQPALNRAQVADFLWRMAGSPPASPSTWTDVPASLLTAAGWLQRDRIMLGDRNRSFHPTAPVTRGDMVTFLWRLAGSPTGLPPHDWNDGTLPLADALNWAYSIGLVWGFADGGFHPTSVMTRGQAAKWLFSYHQLGLTTVGSAPAVAAAPPTQPTTVPSPATSLPTVPPDTLPPTTVPPSTVPPSTTPPSTTPPTAPPITP